MSSSRTRRAGKMNMRTEVIIVPSAAGIASKGNKTSTTARRNQSGVGEVNAKARYMGKLKTSTIQED